VSALFSKLEGLDNLARRDGVDTRPTLVRVLTDLYIQKPAHSSEEERHYTELVLRLIDTVDLATRVAVAKKIAGYPGAPPAVARRLARDVIEVAEPVLRHSAVLTMTDFDAIVRDFGFEHACVIASRNTPANAPVVLPTVAVATVATAAVDIEVESAHASADFELAGLFFAADPAARRMLLMSVGNAEGEAPAAPMVRVSSSSFTGLPLIIRSEARRSDGASRLGLRDRCRRTGRWRWRSPGQGTLSTARRAA